MNMWVSREEHERVVNLAAENCAELVESRNAAMERALTAEQTVAEVRARLDAFVAILRAPTEWTESGQPRASGLRAALEAAEKTLEQAAPIANQWCLVSERDEEVASMRKLATDLGDLATARLDELSHVHADLAAATARVAELETTLGYYSDEARGECTDAYRDLITRAEKAEAQLLDTARVLHGHIDAEGTLVLETGFAVEDVIDLVGQARVVRRLACLTRQNRERAEKAEAALSAAEQVVKAAEVVTFSPLSKHASVKTLQAALDTLHASKAAK